MSRYGLCCWRVICLSRNDVCNPTKCAFFSPLSTVPTSCLFVGAGMSPMPVGSQKTPAPFNLKSLVDSFRGFVQNVKGAFMLHMLDDRRLFFLLSIWRGLSEINDTPRSPGKRYKRTFCGVICISYFITCQSCVWSNGLVQIVRQHQEKSVKSGLGA